MGIDLLRPYIFLFGKVYKDFCLSIFMVKKMRVKRFGVLSVANITALVYLVLAPFSFLISYVSGAIRFDSFLEGLTAFFLNIIMLTFSGWVGTVIVVSLYNLFSKRIGGIEVSLE
jgi:hypothetical protein